MDIPVKTEPPPLDTIPSHVSVDLIIDTDDEISNPANIEPESVENDELEKSDEICDTQSTGIVGGENDVENTNTDVPKEVNDLINIFQTFMAKV